MGLPAPRAHEQPALSPRTQRAGALSRAGTRLWQRLHRGILPVLLPGARAPGGLRPPGPATATATRRTRTPRTRDGLHPQALGLGGQARRRGATLVGRTPEGERDAGSL